MKTLATSLLLLALVAFGCGGGSSSEDVSETFFNALAEGNGEEACAQLSEDGVANIAGEGESCEEQILVDVPEDERARLDGASVEEITEETEQCDPPSGEDDAKVEATLEDEIECVDLIKVGDDWKIEDV